MFTAEYPFACLENLVGEPVTVKVNQGERPFGRRLAVVEIAADCKGGKGDIGAKTDTSIPAKTPALTLCRPQCRGLPFCVVECIGNEIRLYSIIMQMYFQFRGEQRIRFGGIEIIEKGLCDFPILIVNRSWYLTSTKVICQQSAVRPDHILQSGLVMTLFQK